MQGGGDPDGIEEIRARGSRMATKHVYKEMGKVWQNCYLCRVLCATPYGSAVSLRKRCDTHSNHPLSPLQGQTEKELIIAEGLQILQAWLQFYTSPN
jgi:hypothetical protein